jgi:hypothetical protein
MTAGEAHVQAAFGLSYETTVALLTFLCLSAASLGTLLVYDRLPAHHRDDKTLDTVRLVANIFVMLSSLVLGLMVSSASSNFAEVDKAVHAYATEIILLDRALRGLGPDGDPARAELLGYVTVIVGSRGVERPALPAENKSAEATLRDIGVKLAALRPSDPEMISGREQAKAQVNTLLRSRWGLVDRTEGSVPFPLVVSLVLWLSMTMASFGYRAPKNAVVMTSFVVASMLLAGAILLILDMAKPFDGPIQASSEPFIRALAELKL